MDKRIALVSCGSKKLKCRSQAQYLYTGTLFRYSLNYVKKLNPDQIFILSAKHGLLYLEQEIDPYDQSLNVMPANDIQKWAGQILEELKNVCSIDRTEFLILAGNRYRQYLIPHIKNIQVPLAGLGIGKQIQKLKRLCNEP